MNPCSPLSTWTKAATAFGWMPSDLLFVVDAASQQLYVLDEGEVGRLPASTAANGLGETEDSFCTPRGWHRVAERIGAGEPAGRRFFSRQPQLDEPVPEKADLWSGVVDLKEGAGEERDADSGEDLILSRILWLEGLEPGKNQGGQVDSYRRFIYLHGTNHEDKLGTPCSKGCIRLGNKDIIELFDRGQGREIFVWIGELERK